MTDELKQWEYDKGYEKGRADGVREFAEWFFLPLRGLFNIDEVISEWEQTKEKNNETK